MQTCKFRDAVLCESRRIWFSCFDTNLKTYIVNLVVGTWVKPAQEMGKWWNLWWLWLEVKEYKGW